MPEFCPLSIDLCHCFIQQLLCLCIAYIPIIIQDAGFYPFKNLPTVLHSIAIAYYYSIMYLVAQIFNHPKIPAY